VNLEQVAPLIWYIVTYGGNVIPHLYLVVINFLCIVDDFSRVTWVYLLKDKSEAYEHVVDICCMVKTKFGTHVKKAT